MEGLTQLNCAAVLYDLKGDVTTYSHNEIVTATEKEMIELILEDKGTILISLDRNVFEPVSEVLEMLFNRLNVSPKAFLGLRKGFFYSTLDTDHYLIREARESLKYFKLTKCNATANQKQT